MNQNTKKPSISVIIPVYNVYSYLKEAIDSVILQKEHLHEIIIIDDGSTDGSGELLEKLYCDEKIIRIIHTKNNGAGLARNIGLGFSTGDYVHFFDSDDILCLNLYKSFSQFYKENPDIDLYWFSADSFLDQDIDTASIFEDKLLDMNHYKQFENKLYKTGEDAFNSMIKNNTYYVSVLQYIFKTENLRKYNILFDFSKHEDESFTPNILLNSKKTYLSEKIFFKRRVRIGSAMQAKRNQQSIVSYLKVLYQWEHMLNNSCSKHTTAKNIRFKMEQLALNIILIKEANEIVLDNSTLKFYKETLKSYTCKSLKLFIAFYSYPTFKKISKMKAKQLAKFK